MAALFGDPALPDGICSLNCSTEEHAVNDLIGRSFAGTPTTDPEFSVDWCLGPGLADRGSPLRAEAAAFFLSFSAARSVARLCNFRASSTVDRRRESNSRRPTNRGLLLAMKTPLAGSPSDSTATGRAA